jgi:hypothetical protein
MRLEAAIQGDLREYMKKQVTAAEAAVTAGVKDVTSGVQGDLRQQTTAAGLGQKVANAWRAKYYPSGKSIKAAGFVYTKAPNIIYAFDYGVTIKSASGFFLAIPTPAAPKRGTNGKRINPSNFPEGSLGRLRFVYRQGRPSLLVVDNLRARTGKRGGFARASDSAIARQRGVATAVMFLLVPQVSLKKKLNVDAVRSKWENALGGRILANWQEINE